MTVKEALFNYVLRIADDSLILGQRLAEWCGHGPILEEDIALTNISLDLIGQATNLFQYASTLEGNVRNEDQLAFLRVDREFTNFDDFFNKYIKPSIYEFITDEDIINFKSFIKLLIKFDPVNRPTFDELLKHPFLIISDD